MIAHGLVWQNTLPFSFWPGGASASVWGTNYAGHFLIEARRRGYYVPPELLAGWIRFQSARALSTGDPLVTRVYRVYLLSLAGEFPSAGMNLLKESSLGEMNDTMK